MKRLTSIRRGCVARILVFMLVHLVVSGMAIADPSWTITRLTNDGVNYSPAISGSNVVWEGWDGAHWQIYSNFAGQLTNNSLDNMYPDVSGMNVVWMGGDGSHWDIYMAQPVPVPGAVLLGVLGLGIAGLKLRSHA